MAENRKSRAGFFSLCLNTAQNPKTKHLNFRIDVADKLLEDFASLKMTKNAMQNLKGIFQFYRRDQLKAVIDCFKDVLQTNHYNKNAVAHMISVYQRLHMNSKAKQYKDMQERFEEQREKNCGSVGHEYTCVGNMEQDNFLFEYYDAEALAEHGIAFFMDCYTEEDEWVRANRSLKLFIDSLNLIRSVKEKELEQQTKNDVLNLELEVKYWLGQCYHKVYQGVWRRENTATQPGHRDSYCEGIQCLWDITMSDVASQDLKAWTWAYLGVFFFKKPRQTPKHVQKFIEDLNIEKEYQNPEICFVRALDMEIMDHRSTEIRIRYATYLRTSRNRDHLEKAIDLLREAWQICPEDGNWFAKTMLSQVNMKMYRLLKNKVQSSDTVKTNQSAGLLHEGPTVNSEETKQCLGKHNEDNCVDSKNIERSIQKPNEDLVVDPEKSKQCAEKSCEKFLEDAIKFGEEALHINTTAMDLANIAEAYYLKGLKSDGTMDAESDDAMQAAEYFWQAVQCLGTEKKPEIHKKHGLFLKAIGEDRQAIECFKRGMEVDIPNRPIENFKQLFETFLKMYSKEKEFLESEQESRETGQEFRETGHEDGETGQEFRETGQEVCETGQEFHSHDQRQITQTDVAVEVIHDLELDQGIPSTTDSSQFFDNSLKPIKDASKSCKTWTYKQNMLLYEMTYWYQYAARNYERRKILESTKKYVQDFPQEMSMMHAYLEQDPDSVDRNSQAVGIIQDSLEESETEETTLIKDLYRQKVMYAKSLLATKMEKEQEANVEERGSHCSHCCQPYPDPERLVRQNSFIPDIVPQPRNTYYKYDFYVIFCQSEKEWVYYSLLQKLEKSYQFKGAIPERDYQLGYNKFTEMERCIKESLKVLIVLSSNVGRTEEIKNNYEIDFALSLHHNMARGHNIIPVLKDDYCLPPRQLNTLACVNAVQSNAWERIVLALESK
ncbi:uncharacterized protein LOC132558173 [Ylistrum balloti]|uniref:uncharacterized protein LOC132558173 n=1 Tax=Ylistrum balloti TaxID=509963 RepID=UPI002905981C|nr:uncharacterized protein LOC132558173 [Ylistrum balloti]